MKRGQFVVGVSGYTARIEREREREREYQVIVELADTEQSALSIPRITGRERFSRICCSTKCGKMWQIPPSYWLRAPKPVIRSFITILACFRGN